MPNTPDRTVRPQADTTRRSESAQLPEPAWLQASPESSPPQDPNVKRLSERRARGRRGRLRVWERLFSQETEGVTSPESLQIERARARVQRELQGIPYEGFVASPALPKSEADRQLARVVGPRTHHRLVGFNQTKLYIEEDSRLYGTAVETRSGIASDQWNDLATLGAGVVRQHGSRDLLLEMFVDPATGTYLQEIPFPGPAAVAAIENEINVDRIADLMQAALTNGVGVRFTWLTLGAGAKRSRTFDDPNVLGTAGPVNAMVGLQWAAGWPFDDLRTLDLRHSGKVLVLGALAQAAGRVLAAAAARVGAAVADVVDAIEIFNEVDTRSRMVDSLKGVELTSESAAYWAQAWWQCARGFRQGLGLDGGVVPLWLPGLTSWTAPDGSSTRPYATWSHGMEFLSALLAHIEALCLAEGELLSDWVGGLDLHWYHGERESAAVAGPLHIAFLVKEVEEARYVLDTFGLVDATLSVMENGTSADDRVTAVPAWAVGAAGFQGWDLWRRLGGALASSADVIGWHAWMSRGEAFGVRKDTQADSAPPSDAAPRLAWGAFRRFCDLLGSVTDGTMIMPVAPLRESLPGAMSNTFGLVVFEYQLAISPRPEQWAYLVFVDPYQTSGSRYFVRVARADGGVGGVVTASLWPSASEQYSTVPGGLLKRHLTYPPDASFAVPSSWLNIVRAADPLLLFSHSRLLWTPLVSTTHTGLDDSEGVVDSILSKLADAVEEAK